MNVGTKVLNKTLALQTQEHIKWIMRADQMGFILGMQEYFNIIKSINLIHYIRRIKGNTHDYLN